MSAPVSYTFDVPPDVLNKDDAWKKVVDILRAQKDTYVEASPKVFRALVMTYGKGGYAHVSVFFWLMRTGMYQLELFRTAGDIHMTRAMYEILRVGVLSNEEPPQLHPEKTSQVDGTFDVSTLVQALRSPSTNVTLGALQIAYRYLSAAMALRSNVADLLSYTNDAVIAAHCLLTLREIETLTPEEVNIIEAFVSRTPKKFSNQAALALASQCLLRQNMKGEQ